LQAVSRLVGTAGFDKNRPLTFAFIGVEMVFDDELCDVVLRFAF